LIPDPENPVTSLPEYGPAPDDELPLDLDGTRAWLADWLVEWGLPPDALSEAEMRQIFRVSGGERERVERLAAQRFQDPAQLGPRREQALRRPRLLALVALILIAFLTWVFVYPPRPRTVQEVHLVLPPAPAAQASSPPVYVQAAAPPPPQPAAPPPHAQPPAAAPAPAPAPQSVSIPGLRPADWMAGSDGSRYVLQLIGAAEMQTIEHYVNRAGLPKRKITLVNTVNKGRPWHILVYGSYASHAAARADAERLTPYARRLKPWPRRVAAVRAEAAGQGSQ